MIDRIIKAFTFKTEVYKEVEDDASFSQMAWILVAAVALLSQLGSTASLVHVSGRGWIPSALIGTVIAVASFAFSCFIISWAGKQFFKADVTFDEMVRTLGLAYVWNIVGFLGIIGAVSPGLSCVTAPLRIAGSVAGLVAWFFAAKEALDLEWPETIGTVVIGWVAGLIISMIFGVLGLGGAAIGGLFSSLR